MSESRGCSTSAGNELIKREKKENSPREGGTGRVGAANGIVIFFVQARVLTCVCGGVL